MNKQENLFVLVIDVDPLVLVLNHAEPHKVSATWLVVYGKGLNIARLATEEGGPAICWVFTPRHTLAEHCQTLTTNQWPDYSEVLNILV